MKIVNYDEFVRMPAGTVFAPYTPCVFEGNFEIKVDEGRQWGDKWTFNGTMCLEPWLGDYFQAFDYGTYETELATYDGDSNDASEHKMFAVLEEHEVKRLINALHWALDGCSGDFDEYNNWRNTL